MKKTKTSTRRVKECGCDESKLRQTKKADKSAKMYGLTISGVVKEALVKNHELFWKINNCSKREVELNLRWQVDYKKKESTIILDIMDTPNPSYSLNK